MELFHHLQVHHPPSLIVAMILLLCAGLIGVFLWYVKRKQSFWARHGISTPKYTFGVGHSIDRLVAKEIPSQVFERYYKQSKDDIVGLYFFTKPVAMIRDMDLLKKIMISDFDHFMSRGVYYNEEDDPVSAHLFSLSGHKWRKLRAKLTPTFTSGKMKLMFPIVFDISKSFVTAVNEAVLDNPSGMEIKQLTSRFTTDVIGNCAFGIECNSLREPENNAYQLINKGVFARSLWKIAQLHFAQNFPDFSRKMGITSVTKEVSDFYVNLVTNAINHRRKTPEPRNDFMNILVQMHENPKSDEERITIKEIAAQSFLFFVAGFDTSASTMMFALYELAKNINVQEQAVKHINNVLAKYGGELSYDCLAELDYLDRVIDGEFDFNISVKMVYK